MSTLLLEKKVLQNEMAMQLETIFSLAPGRHELRIIGRWYERTVKGNTAIACMLEKEGDRALGYSLGLASSAQEAMQKIAAHFAVDCQPTHNVFAVTNSVDDDFELAMKPLKIGKKWTSISYFCTKAMNICSLNSIIIDIDRAETAKNELGQKLCASEEELAKLDVARKDIVQFFATLNVSPAYQICSGNGFQLAIFFPPQEVKIAKPVVATILTGLKKKYGPDGIGIDITLKDPSRVSRLAGGLNKKYDREECPEQARVHRIATLIENAAVLTSWDAVLALSEAVKTAPVATKVIPPAKSSLSANNPARDNFDSEAYLREVITSNATITVKKETTENCKVRFILDECLFDSTHTGGEASLFVASNGTLCYQCFHDSCQSRTWQDVKKVLKMPTTDKPTTVCKDCGKEIKFVQQKNGKWAPKDTDGKAHKCKKETEKNEEKKKTPRWINDKGGVITGVVAQEYLDNQKGTLIFSQSMFWRYAGGYWQQIDPILLQRDIQTMLGDTKSTQRTINDVIFNLEKKAWKDVIWNPSPFKLCFRNTVLDVMTKKTEHHSADLYQTNQFAFDYYEDAYRTETFSCFLQKNAPNFLKFLIDFGFQQATYNRLQQWFGYCLIPTTKIERCLFLKGEGSNGKSTLLLLLQNLLGKAQYAVLEPCEYFESFKTGELQNKLANISTDIESGNIFDARFKKLVSGEETVARPIFHAPYKFIPYAKFIFSANDFISTKDRSNGFFRRFDVLNFSRIFAEKERDVDLKEKLLREAQYVLYWAIEGLLSLISNNWQFYPSAEFESAKAEFEHVTNHVRQFIDECYVTTPDGGGELCSTFRDNYVCWCIKYGYKALSEVSLGRELKRLGIERKKNGPKLRQKYYYLGIAKVQE